MYLLWCALLHESPARVVGFSTLKPAHYAATTSSTAFVVRVKTTATTKTWASWREESHEGNNNHDNNSSSSFPGQRTPEDWKKVAENFDPFAFRTNRPNKADLYSNQDLENLWNVHNSLEFPETTPSSKQRDDDDDDDDDQQGDLMIPSLHDLVLETVQTLETEQFTLNGGEIGSPPPLEIIVESTTSTTMMSTTPGSSSSSSSSKSKYKYILDDEMRSQLQRIRAVASDVDGTLLSSDHSLTASTKAAVEKAVETAFSPLSPLEYFFPATGKSRAGALQSLGPDMSALLSQVPGVFLQGLYCVSASGDVIFERRLNASAVSAAVELAKEQNVSVFAYDGDSIFAAPHSDPKHIHEFHHRWGEPLPVVRDESFVEYAAGWHKMLFMDDDTDKIATVMRPLVNYLAQHHQCAVTTAIPTMLELLPQGCSKALGVQKVCEHLGVDPFQELVAIGDAENDVELLEMAACGVAVANAVDKAKAAADIVLEESNDDGGAGIAIELFGLGLILQD